LQKTTFKVLITGANGFIGKNLKLRLSERPNVQVICYSREHNVTQLPELLQDVDFVFHLAGINRTLDPQEYVLGNTKLTQALCGAVANVALTTGRRIPVVFSSSIQANCDNHYGQSKRSAEEALFALQHSYDVPVYVFRLPNVFGKWCKPNYNSVVATFCHNVARGLPIQIYDPVAPLTLVYVDDVISRFLQLMDGDSAVTDDLGFASVTPQYFTTVGELARRLQVFKDSRTTLVTERVGAGWTRALYATYVSYLPPESFSYTSPQHEDPRGVFAEMLKTPDCGQFSYFTAHPGVTRGGHYHHSKTEKFLVIKGQARFKFRHMHTGESHELLTNGEKAEVVETVPGWTHDITNIGSDEMIVMLWANEVFDPEKPDTFASAV
jgi:UDP-2-acetamido-2,6-beta-L-arabino-hexul-4-ose reductase